MAKKDNDNFDFETEGKAKVDFDLSFLKNLTKQQKGIILIAAVAVVLVVAIIITCVALGVGGNGNGGSGSGNSGSGENGGNDNYEIPDEITGMLIASEPSKLIYYVGDTVDYSGLSVTVTEGINTKHTVFYDDSPEDFTITGFDSSVAVESQTITVECRGFTDTFTVEIRAIADGTSALQSITVIPPTKTTYEVGKPLDLTGGYIEAHYSDGTTETIKLRMKYVSGYSAVASIPGEHEIKVAYYDDFGGYAETTFTITITE